MFLFYFLLVFFFNLCVYTCYIWCGINYTFIASSKIASQPEPVQLFKEYIRRRWKAILYIFRGWRVKLVDFWPQYGCSAWVRGHWGQCPQMGSGAHSIPVCDTGQADLHPISTSDQEWPRDYRYTLLFVADFFYNLDKRTAFLATAAAYCPRSMRTPWLTTCMCGQTLAA